MRGLIILMSLLYYFQSYGQDKRGNVWVFGQIAEGLSKQVFLDFNAEPAILREFEGQYSMTDGTVSTYANREGEIIMYTNGCEIVGKDHEIIENGDSIFLHPQPFSLCDFGFVGSIDGPLFLPQPCDGDKVNLLAMESSTEDFDLFTLTLSNTTIDLSDEANPRVIEKRKSVLADTLAPGNIYASRHANGRDWWITVLESKSDCFYSVLLNENGFSEPIKSCTGPRWSFFLPESTFTFEDVGQGCFSPDGNVYVRYSSPIGLNVYDFDNTTGVLAHREQIFISNPDGFLGAAISPNSRFVYASADSLLYQYDLEADSISSSEQIVAVQDLSIFRNPQFSLSRLAPDGKIYISGFADGGLHIIHNPNLEGEACNVEQKGVQFPDDMLHFDGLPNNPWYGAIPDNSPCDSLLSVSTIDLSIEHKIDVYPNPTYGVVTISLPDGLAVKKIELVDTQVVALSTDEVDYSDIKLDLGGYPSGLYFISIYTDKGSVVKKIVLE